jgi:hypothetical protein
VFASLSLGRNAPPTLPYIRDGVAVISICKVYRLVPKCRELTSSSSFVPTHFLSSGFASTNPETRPTGLKHPGAQTDYSYFIECDFIS